MSQDFRSFLRRVTADQPADTPPSGFVPPPAPPANWHSVRDDLEQTVENLRELRSALLRYQALVEQIDRARAVDNVAGSDAVSGAQPGTPPQSGPETERPEAERLGMQRLEAQRARLPGAERPQADPGQGPST